MSVFISLLLLGVMGCGLWFLWEVWKLDSQSADDDSDDDAYNGDNGI